jgi:hypothetical protein
MLLQTENHLEMAAFFDSLSANEHAALQARRAFARKANWHRVLARMSSGIDDSAGEAKASGQGTEQQAEDLLFSPSRLWAARDKSDLELANDKANRAK